jgi:type II secretory pathway pseudopilin PulG
MKKYNFTSKHFRSCGFTLVEIAIVLLIITLLLTGLVPTVSSQIEQRQTNDVRKQLDDIQQALTGYAIIYERLPCPATTSSNGLESFAVGGSAVNGNCSGFYDGFVPAATLGLTPVNSQGLVVDPWNNPIRYAVSSSYANAFTTAGGMKTSSLLSSAISLDLQVCSIASANTTNCTVANSSLASNGVPAVILSTGKNGVNIGTNPDEAANLHTGASINSKIFVSHDFTPTYDDQVVWVSPNVLFNRMVAAGKLP